MEEFKKWILDEMEMWCNKYNDACNNGRNDQYYLGRIRELDMVANKLFAGDDFLDEFRKKSSECFK